MADDQAGFHERQEHYSTDPHRMANSRKNKEENKYIYNCFVDFQKASENHLGKFGC